MASSRAARIFPKLEIPALILAPVSLITLAFFPIDQSAIISMVVVLLCVLIFFVSFESSKPQLRQIMPTVVLAALAAAGRIIFATIPSVQPVSAIAIIAGVVFGRKSGFMVGALSILISNFYLGQGPWAPWQMYGFGLIGYLAGVFAMRGFFKKRAVLYGFAFFAPLIAYSFLLNLWYVVAYVHPITLPAILLTFGAALPMDIAHAISCVVFLFVLYEPWAKKLERIKRKYDLIPEDA